MKLVVSFAALVTMLAGELLANSDATFTAHPAPVPGWLLDVRERGGEITLTVGERLAVRARPYTHGSSAPA